MSSGIFWMGLGVIAVFVLVVAYVAVGFTRKRLNRLRGPWDGMG